VVAANAGITGEEVIRIHEGGTYPVYMMGFTPGFCYLGGLDCMLHTPRRAEPRLKVPAGSVGIAGNQTGIYAIESPGGWQIIGRTPLKLFDPGREKPFLCRAGMRIRFRRLSENPFAGAPEPLESDRSINGVSPDAAIVVIEPGFQTTIQDSGRPGFQEFGVPVCGAMDQPAYRLANRLVGNTDLEAVFEITFRGPVLEFRREMKIAVTGADIRPILNGREYGTGMALSVRPGDRLSFGAIRSGLRSCLAVSGGIDVPPVMGSRSTYLRAGIGGFQGRALQTGDEIPVKQVPEAGSTTGATPGGNEHDPLPVVPSARPAIIRFIPGPDTARFTTGGLSTFLASEYALSVNSDRMGIRLDGPAVQHAGEAGILSSGVIPGTIQVPGDGKPIVLMMDCQTTGGYSRIGCVVQDDLRILAQLRPGEKVRFRAVYLDGKW
jgi:antagonist of KipI